MAWKPRYDHQRCCYFKQAYEAEFTYLNSLLKLLQEIMKYQMDNEFKNNREIIQYLNKSFHLADEYTKMKWDDVPADQIE